MFKNKLKASRPTKHQFLYWYIVLSGILMFSYAIAWIFLPIHIAFIITPIALVLIYFIFLIIKKNIKLFWLYITDMERGQLILYLQKMSIWNQHQIENVAHWIYPKRGEVRGEEVDAYNRSIYEGVEVPKEDIKKFKGYKGRPLRLTHDPQDGIQRLVLVDALIYADTNIKPLDNTVREKFELTDENMTKFDLQTEINKLKYDK